MNIRPKSRLAATVSALALAGGLIVATLGATTAIAKTTPGDPDPSFNGGVPVVIDDNATSQALEPFAAAINPLNGDILWVGAVYINATSTQEGAVVAYKPDGTPDTNFGFAGTDTISATAVGLPGGQIILMNLAVDAQGRILVTGEVATPPTARMILIRLKPDGSFDTGFGAGGTGVVFGALNDAAVGVGLSLTADGHILVTGEAADTSASNLELTVWRYDADGKADTDFGTGGHVQIPQIKMAAPGLAFCHPALQTDGALLEGCLLADNSSTPAPPNFKITRLKPDGTVDTTFGASGFIAGPAASAITGLDLAPDGGFFISYVTVSKLGGQYYLARYLAAGTADSSFNGGSPLLIGALPSASTVLRFGDAMAVQPDGRVFVGIGTGANTLFVSALRPDGTFDTGFGSGGVATIDFKGIAGNNYTPYPTALRVQADGALVVAGPAHPTATYYAAFVTRLVNDAWDLTPDTPAFKDVTPAPLGEAVASNAVAVSGVSIGSETSGIGLALTANNGKYSTSGAGGPFKGSFTGSSLAWIGAGDQLALEQMTPDTATTDTTTQVALGGFWAPNNYEIPLGAPATAQWTTTTDQPPVAHDGALTATTAKAASGTLDADNPSGGTLAFAIVTKPAHGTVSLDDAAKGSYTYTADSGYSGDDSFTWKVNDGIADSNTAKVSITVNAVTPPPKDNGGGSLGALGLLALALLGPGACLLRRRHAQ